MPRWHRGGSHRDVLSHLHVERAVFADSTRHRDGSGRVCPDRHLFASIFLDLRIFRRFVSVKMYLAILVLRY